MYAEAMELYKAIRKEGMRPSITSLNSLLDSLVSSNQFGKTLDLFEEIIGFGFRANKFMYGKAIQAAVKLGDLKKANGFMGCMKNEGLSPSLFIYNVLISGLCKEKRIRDAEKVFDEISERKLVPSLVTYNSLIDGYCKVVELEKAFGLKERMVKENVEPNIVTFHTLANGLCRAGKIDEAKRVLKEMEAQGFAADGYTFSILFDGFLKSGDVESASTLYEEMSAKGVGINRYMLSNWLNHLCKEGNFGKAEEVKKMREKGVSPNVQTYNNLINGYEKMKVLDMCFAIIEEMEMDEIKPSSVSYGSLINCLTGHVTDAFSYFDEMVKSGTRPTIVKFNTLINGLYKKGKVTEVEALLPDIMSNRCNPDVITYNTLLSGYSNQGNAHKCLELYENIKSSSIKPTLTTYHALITGCNKEGIELAERLFHKMEEMHLTPDLLVYNAMIHLYSEHGDVENAFSLYHKMIDQGISPDKMTYNSLILGQFKRGNLLEIKDLVGDMRSKGLVPKCDTYDLVIKGYCEHKDFIGAYTWCREMLESHFLPLFTTCNELVIGLRKEGRLQEAQIICSELKAKGMDYWSSGKLTTTDEQAWKDNGVMEQPKHEGPVPEKEKKKKNHSENIITALESRMATNQGYVEELLRILAGRTGEQEHSTDEQVQSPDTSKNKEKNHVLVTVVNEKSRFTYKPDEPGILKTKPDAFLALKNSFRPENQVGENSDSRPNLFGLEAEKKGPGCSCGAKSRADNYHIFSDRSFCDIVEEFTKLTQKGSVEDYQEKFEELQPYMLLQNPTLTEEFFVSLFISGLRDDIKHRVKALDPKNLSEAFKQAKLYELSVEFENRRFRPSFKIPPNPNPITTSKTTALPVTTKPHSIPNPKQNLMDYRRQNSICFKCGEKYIPGHQCKTRQLNMITEEIETSLLEVCPTDAEQNQQQEEENLEISMNAITGCIGHNTLRIQGTIQGKPLNILIESGSTHSFLTPKWADAGIQINTAYPLAIAVANGQQLFRVSTDPSKVEVMQNWPQPKTLKSLRGSLKGFLGLTGYYRRFIRHYGLKKAICYALILVLPGFSKTFYLETDASSGGVGVVLSQEGRPIAYLSKALSPRHSALSIYEREYLAILLAFSKWRHYLESGTFVIKTDHEPLKFLLEQKLTITIQKKGLTKLLGLDYTIQYRKGKSNMVADALSRRWEDQAQCLTMGVTVLIPSWVQEIEESYKGDSLAQNWISIMTINHVAESKWKFSRAVLRYDERVYIGATGSLRLQIIQSLHDSPQGGHSGAQATYYRIRSNFYWPNLKSMVVTYVRCCQTCQQTKVEHLAKPGLLQPLPIPNQAWEIISMDFIEELPTSLKKNCILVIVDKFTKYNHFLPLAHPYSAAEVAKLYLDNVHKLHGQPKMAISDRDKTFTSLFWKEFMKQLGTKTLFSTAYHPEIDGQTERVNQCLEKYLRGFCFYKPKQWAKWLSHFE
ncbi:Thioredoxin superfamily protein [Hibiscus syriacus]|uniref:Thioredoxin superfamily protein n=1 Tax=Hibiscus syriacus TaxID=106335 RepID=A0A6A2WB84_HIBSY|nr:Thioredoxin superfamily protein [Hibiscus syriacus]